MTTALGVPSGETDGRAFAADHDEALVPRGSDDLEPLDAGADLDGGAIVVLVVPGEEVDVLQVVRPDGQGAGTGGASEVVMAGVPDDEADVVLGCKLDGSNDISRLGNVHGVADVVAQGARLGLGSERIAALIGEEGCHNRGRVVHAAIVRLAGR